MITVRNKKAFYFGMVLVGLGVLFNKWLIGTDVISAGSLTGTRSVIAVSIIEGVLIVSGLYLLVKQPSIEHPNRAEFLLLASGIFIAYVPF